MGNTRRNSGDTTLNVVITVIIVAVLGLGIWAVVPKIQQNIANNAADSSASQTVTVAQLAESAGQSVDEYLAEYGLTDSDITGETDYQTALSAMTLENFAKANGTTADELKSEYKLPESVTNDTPWSEAMLEMPAGLAMGGDEQFAQAKEAYGLGDEFTAESRWGDVQNALMEKLVSQQAASDTADSDNAESDAQTDDNAE